MLTLYKEKTIFSIDNVFDLHQKAKFLRFYDELLAMGKISNAMSEGVGCWEGELEPCFMVNKDVFDKYLRDSRYLKDQVCVLHVAGDTRQPAFIEMLDGSGEQFSAGALRQVSKKDAIHCQGWTHMYDRYYTTDKPTDRHQAISFSEAGFYGENNGPV